MSAQIAAEAWGAIAPALVDAAAGSSSNCEAARPDAEASPDERCRKTEDDFSCGRWKKQRRSERASASCSPKTNGPRPEDALRDSAQNAQRAGAAAAWDAEKFEMNTSLALAAQRLKNQIGLAKQAVALLRAEGRQHFEKRLIASRASELIQASEDNARKLAAERSKWVGARMQRCDVPAAADLLLTAAAQLDSLEKSADIIFKIARTKICFEPERA